MLPADDSPDRSALDAVDHLRHDLKTPLTTIYARVSAGSRDPARSRVQWWGADPAAAEGVAGIEGAVREMVTVIDGIGEKHRGS